MVTKLRKGQGRGKWGVKCSEGQGRGKWGVKCSEGQGREKWGVKCSEGQGREKWGVKCSEVKRYQLIMSGEMYVLSFIYNYVAVCKFCAVHCLIIE